MYLQLSDISEIYLDYNKVYFVFKKIFIRFQKVLFYNEDVTNKKFFISIFILRNPSFLCFLFTSFHFTVIESLAV